MNYIEYLDLPVVPEHLIESVQDIINKPPKNLSPDSQEHPYFKIRDVNDDLKAWLQNMFNVNVFADPQYQLIYDGVPIHIDRGNRIFAYNYLLDTGGDNVETAVYDKDHNLLQCETLKLKQWHRINTGMFHGVHGIDPSQVRVALSIGLIKK